MHVCALVYAGTLSHACVYGEQKTRMYVSFTIYFMLSEIRGLAEPGAHHFEKTVALESPQVHLLGLQMYATTPSFSVGPGDLNLGLMLVQ